jgi:pimeloyl-ACP methyl ester carboxylesterase
MARRRRGFIQNAPMAIATNGPCQLYYDTFGDPGRPTLLMINGLGSQCTNYQDEWCRGFADRGHHVVRFDNRDVGLSTSFADAPVDASGAAYRLTDMAADAIAVLDAVGAGTAHVMGLSMGGMIVQTLAIEHPERLRSATSVMSTTGEPGVGQPSAEAWAMLTAPPATDRESFVARHIAGLRAWGSPEFADEDRWRADAERAFDRAFTPDGTARQFLAVGASGPRAEGLRSVSVPMLVLHGDRDTLIDPSGGRRTAELVPGARFELIEGMGHDYPPQLWERWIDLVTSHTGAVEAGR